MPNVTRPCMTNVSRAVIVRARHSAGAVALNSLLRGLLFSAGMAATMTIFAATGAATGAASGAAGPDLADLVARAKIAQVTGDTTLARALLDPALRSPSVTQSERAALYLMRAQLFVDEGAPVSARQDAERATRFDPTNGEALSLRARLERDPAVRARLYLKAARQGVTEAQREAGARIMSGLGISADQRPADHRKARYWLLQAANTGDGAAMLLLARSYREAADPAQRDLVLAATWQRRGNAATADNAGGKSADKAAGDRAVTPTDDPSSTGSPPIPTSGAPAAAANQPLETLPARSGRNQAHYDSAPEGTGSGPNIGTGVRTRSADLRAESTHN